MALLPSFLAAHSSHRPSQTGPASFKLLPRKRLPSFPVNMLPPDLQAALQCLPLASTLFFCARPSPASLELDPGVVPLPLILLCCLCSLPPLSFKYQHSPRFCPELHAFLVLYSYSHLTVATHTLIQIMDQRRKTQWRKNFKSHKTSPMTLFMHLYI